MARKVQIRWRPVDPEHYEPPKSEIVSEKTLPQDPVIDWRGAWVGIVIAILGGSAFAFGPIALMEWLPSVAHLSVLPMISGLLWIAPVLAGAVAAR